MNCRTCGYALWNLPTRSCPECDTPFAPTQFQFRRHSVAFCCPGCDQPYYGVGAGGHLEPRAFTCVKCGRATHEDEMVLRPTDGVVEERTRVLPVPWLNRDIRSTTARLLRTTIWSLFLPGQLGRRLPNPERTAASLGFAALWTVVLLLPTLVLAVIGGLMLGPASMLAGFAFGVGIWSFVSLFPWALLTHLGLVISGPRRGGYGKTLACHAYAMPTSVPLAIPILGFYLAPFTAIYTWLVTAIMLKYAQSVSWWRALLATAIFPLLCALAIGTFIALVIVPSYRSAMKSIQPVSTPTQQSTTISAAIFTYARTNAGAGPAHLSELLLDGSVGSHDLLSGISYRSDSRAMIASQPLLAFDYGRVPQNAAAVQAWVNANIPSASITAHRLGDVVATYHGINLNAPADAGLWIFVITTEPSRFAVATASNTGTPARPPLAIARADGTITEIADATFASELDAQNTLRAKHGLAKIPDPRQLLANGFTTPADAPP